MKNIEQMKKTSKLTLIEMMISSIDPMFLWLLIPLTYVCLVHQT